MTSPDLLVGIEGSDDAGVLRIAPDRALVLTTDFFTPIVDDPRTFGRIAATNSLSDVWAMGGRPLAVLNIIGFPSDTLPLDVLTEILNGGSEKIRESGAVLAGGHSVWNSEVLYGLAVTGEVHPDRIWRNGGARPGDALVLTKPLGTGLITSKLKAEGGDFPGIREAVRWMTLLNGTGFRAITERTVHACTDITGFGLAGHAAEMAAGSAALLRIHASRLPRIRGVETAFEERFITGGARTNRSHTSRTVHVDARIDAWTQELAFDPQTSGGLLIALPAAEANGLVTALRGEGLEAAAVIGEVHPRRDEAEVEFVS